jgi:hypothetical protein
VVLRYGIVNPRFLIPVAVDATDRRVVLASGNRSRTAATISS